MMFIRHRSVVAALVAVASPLASAAVLDAHYAPASTVFVTAVTAPPNYGIEDAAQTFTVEHTGTLNQLDLQLERGVNAGTPSGNLHWDIRPLASGAPDPDSASALLSGDIPATAITADAPDKTYVSVTGLNLPVTAGQQLAIVLHHNDGANYFGWGADSAGPAGPYAGGAYFDRQDPATTFTQFPSFDQAFRTFVAVPEPATASLAALVACGFALRRRRPQP